jgi:hypothetical protein
MDIIMVRFLVQPPWNAVLVDDGGAPPDCRPVLDAGNRSSFFVLCNTLHAWMTHSDISYQLVAKNWKVYIGFYHEQDLCAYNLAWGSVSMIAKNKSEYP